MFNLGTGEIVVLILLGLILLGPSKLPNLAEGLSHRTVRVEPRWSWSDWLLACAAVISAVMALAVFLGAQR